MSLRVESPMLDFFLNLFDTSDFPQRWNCGNWTSELGWLHIVSDLATWAAYTAIPCVMGYFILKRRDVPFPRVFWLFCAFIFACGTVHLVEALIFWLPVYRLSGAMKFVTAAVSWATVFALIPVTPVALAMRGPEELEAEIKRRRHVEEKLRVQAVAMETSMDGIAILDSDWNVTYANNSFAKKYGFKSVDEVLGKAWGSLHRDVEGSSTQSSKRMPEAIGQKWLGELEAVRIDGTTFSAEVSIASLESGGYVSISRNINERKHAERQLRELNRSLEERVAAKTIELKQQAEKIRVVFESAPNAMITVNRKGKIELVNAAAETMFAFSRSELIGSEIERLVPQASRLEHPELRDAYFKNPSPRPMGRGRDLYAVRSDGSPFPVEIGLSPFLQGDEVHVVATVVDITARKQAEQAILDRSRELEENIVQRRRSEQALRISEERLSLAARASNDGMWDYELGSHHVWCNGAYEEIRGEPLDLVDDEFAWWFERIHPDDVSMIRQSFQHALSNREEDRWMGSYRYLRQDGSYAYVFDRAYIARDEAGRATRVVGALADRTEQKRAEESLSHSEERFRTLFEQAGVGVAIMDTQSGKYVRVNQKLCDILGYSAEELEDIRFSQITYPEDLKPGLEGIEALKRGTISQFAVEKRYVKKDGSVVWAHLTASPLWKTNNELVLHVAIIEDITARKQAEEEIVRLNRQLQLLIEAIQELAAARDLPTLMARVCRAARQLTSADGATFVLREDEECVYADEDAVAPLCKGQRLAMDDCLSGWVMKNRQPAAVYDIDVDPRIGSEPFAATFAQSLAVYPVGTSDPYAAICVYWARQHSYKAEMELLGSLADATAIAMQNVMTLDQLEQRVNERTAQLKTANKELEAFSYSVSHDLRAPLRAIDGFSRILMEDYSEQLPEDAVEFLTDIRSNTQRMGQLVDDLLAFSRLGRAPIQLRQVETDRIVAQCWKELEPERQQRNVKWKIGELSPCMADPGLLTQVWLNLLTNALKYSGRRELAEIEVGCFDGPDAGDTTYFVKDNGVGFDMRYADKLFGVFQRLHKLEDYEGTGVGLAIVKRIVERHGGKVWAQAEPDRGAQFFFSLKSAT